MKPTKRLQIIDILRGHLLVAMIFDHFFTIVGVTIFSYYNWNGNLWVSAAEGFIAISGFMIGYIYIFNRKLSFKEILKKIVKRTLLIYLLYIFLTLLFTIFWGNYPLPQSNISTLDTEWYEILAKTLLLQYQHGWSDILALYVYYLIGSPIIIYLFRKKNYIPVILGSLILWGLSNLKLIPNFTVSYFSVFSWQVLFVFGILVGAKYEYIKTLLLKLYFNKFVVITTIAIFLFTVFLGVKYPEVIVSSYNLFDKSSLAIGRLILVPLYLCIYMIIIRLIIYRLPSFILQTYNLLGRNSLFVYSIHSVVLAFATVYVVNISFISNSLTILLGLSTVIVITYLYSKFISNIKGNLKLRFKAILNTFNH